MKYEKPALTFAEQANRLLSRGLVADHNELVNILKAVSYYRLSAYWHTFRIEGDPDDRLRPGTTLTMVWNRYVFDRQLRLLVMDAIERVEVAIRTQIINRHVLNYGPFGYPSGSILVWETEKEQPTRQLAVSQQANAFDGHRLLLDGQQRLTSLSAVLRGEPIKVRGRKRDIEILFNLDHPDTLTEFSEVVGDEESALEAEDEADEREQEEEEVSLPERLKRMTFVVASKALAQQPNWVSVTKVFKTENDAEILKAAGVKSFDDPRYEKYSARLKKLRSIRDYPYVMHVLQRDLSYEEVAEIFVRVNSLGAKLRGSDLALPACDLSSAPPARGLTSKTPSALPA